MERGNFWGYDAAGWQDFRMNLAMAELLLICAGLLPPLPENPAPMNPEPASPAGKAEEASGRGQVKDRLSFSGARQRRYWLRPLAPWLVSQPYRRRWDC